MRDPLGENHAQGDAVLALLLGLVTFGAVAWVVAGRPFWTAAHTYPGHGVLVARRCGPLRRACSGRWGPAR